MSWNPFDAASSAPLRGLSGNASASPTVSSGNVSAPFVFDINTEDGCCCDGVIGPVRRLGAAPELPYNIQDPSTYTCTITVAPEDDERRLAADYEGDGAEQTRMQQRLKNGSIRFQ